MINIHFQPLAMKDLEKLYLWFQLPHIKKWYAKGLNFSKNDIEQKYANRITGKENIPSYIVLINNHEIGFIQYYSLKDSLPEGVANYDHQLFKEFPASDMAGIDLFIANIDYLNQGYGKKILNAFLRNIIFTKFKAVVIDPNIENIRAIKAYEKVGFKTFSFEQSEQYHETIQLMIFKNR